MSKSFQFRGYRNIVSNRLKRLNPLVQRVWPHFSKFSWWIVGVVFGAIVTHRVDIFLGQSKVRTTLKWRDITWPVCRHVVDRPTHLTWMIGLIDFLKLRDVEEQSAAVYHSGGKIVPLGLNFLEHLRKSLA
jgi:hypothetical protein